MLQVLGLVDKMRQDVNAKEQAELKMKGEADRYAEKYREANEVLKLQNTEKAILEQEKKEVEKIKSDLEKQVEELSQEKKDFEAQVTKMNEVTEFWGEKGTEAIVATCLKLPKLYQ